MVNAKKMTAPTKQQLREMISELREEVSHLQNQLAENESLRDKLASKAGMADHLEKTLKEYSDYHFKASCVHDLSAQLTLNDVFHILWMFRTRLDAVIRDGDDAIWLEFAEFPFVVEGGNLTFVFEREQNQATDS
jgi:DNA repair exonuclease SbcCD ATPase subunit